MSACVVLRTGLGMALPSEPDVTDDDSGDSDDAGGVIGARNAAKNTVDK